MKEGGLLSINALCRLPFLNVPVGIMQWFSNLICLEMAWRLVRLSKVFWAPSPEILRFSRMG